MFNPYSKAMKLACNAHGVVKRKNGKDMYFIHPIDCANILWELGCRDQAVLDAALNHDVPEDTDVKVPDLERELGKEIAEIVQDVTDNKADPAGFRKIDQVDHGSNIRTKAKYVKIADTISNLQDMVINGPPIGWGARRVQSYFLWKKLVMARITFAPHDELGNNLKQRVAQVMEGTVKVPTASGEIEEVPKLPPCHDDLNFVLTCMRQYFIEMDVGSDQQAFEERFQHFQTLVTELYEGMKEHNFVQQE